LKATNAEISGIVNAISLDVARSDSEKSPISGGKHGYVYFGWENAFVDSNGKNEPGGVYLHVWDSSKTKYLMLPMSALVATGISGDAYTLYSDFNLSGDTPVSYIRSNGMYYQGQSPVTASVYYK